MVTLHSFPTSPTLTSQGLSSFAPPVRALIPRTHLHPAESFHPVQGVRRILLLLYCPSHSWNWPRLMPDGSREGFDAHQTCFKCNTQRLYNTTSLTAGPLFRTRVPGGSAPFAPVLAELARLAAAGFTRGLSLAARAFRVARSHAVS